MIKSRILLFLFFVPLLFTGSCKKFTKTDEIIGNQIPYYDEIPTITVENYLNRLYIDLVGREPSDSELVADIAFLRSADLSFASREAIALRLQTDETPREGEGSYKQAYYRWFFQRMNGDLLDGATEFEFEEQIDLIQANINRDSLAGDSVGMKAHQLELKKLLNVLDSEHLYREGKINFQDMVGFMVNNVIYDLINMNSFNFINATYENLLFRYPSKTEFDAAFQIMEYSSPQIIMGKSAQTKDDYVDILVGCKEFYQGMVIRAYHKLVVREPNSAEMAKYTQQLYTNKDYQLLQRQLIITDEYAQFEPSYR